LAAARFVTVAIVAWLILLAYLRVRMLMRPINYLELEIGGYDQQHLGNMRERFMKELRLDLPMKPPGFIH
jgi:hypothetical protein